MGLLDQFSFRLKRGGGLASGNRGQQFTLGSPGPINLSNKFFKRNPFAQAVTAGQLFQSPEIQDFMNQERTVLPGVIEGLFAGNRDAMTSAGNLAAERGLGRGFATQLGVRNRQMNLSDIAQAVSRARIGDIGRRASGAASIASAIQAAQAAMLAKSRSHRASQQAQRNDLTSNLLGLGGTLGGAFLGPLAASLFAPDGGDELSGLRSLLTGGGGGEA